MFLFLFPGTGKYSPIHFASTNGKILNDLQYFQIEKKFKWRNWKIHLPPQNRERWSNFFYFSTYFTSFPQSGEHFIVAIYFHEVQEK